MIPKTLRVRATGKALVTNHERLLLGTLTYIGRKLTEVAPGEFVFKPTDEDVEVPYSAEYVKHLRDGDLLPADQATADAVGVKVGSLAVPPPVDPPAPEFSPGMPGAYHDDKKDGDR